MSWSDLSLRMDEFSNLCLERDARNTQTPEHHQYWSCSSKSLHGQLLRALKKRTRTVIKFFNYNKKQLHKKTNTKITLTISILSLIFLIPPPNLISSIILCKNFYFYVQWILSSFTSSFNCTLTKIWNGILSLNQNQITPHELIYKKKVYFSMRKVKL